jgi:hypothetical protein
MTYRSQDLLILESRLDAYPSSLRVGAYSLYRAIRSQNPENRIVDLGSAGCESEGHTYEQAQQAYVRAGA